MQVLNLKELDNSFELLFGDATHTLSGISHSDAPRKGSFCFIKNKKFLENLGRDLQEKDFSEVGLVLEASFAEKDLELVKGLSTQFLWIGKVKNVAEAMCFFSKPFYDQKYNNLNYYVDGRQMGSAEVSPEADIAQNAFIGANCKIEAGVKIFPNVVIMPEVEIGEGTILYPGVVVYPYTKIGKNCRIHAASVIGADGFGYNFIQGAHQKIWHFSGVVIENDVEIGASSTVDCGAFTPTKIGRGTKIDNGVQVGHNAQLGKHVVLCGQVGIAGSARLDDYVVVGGNAGIGPGAQIGRGTMVAGRTGVPDNAIWEAGSKIGGFPAQPLNEWLREKAAIRKLTKK